MATLQDPESAGISLRSLESSLSPKLRESIKKADHDNDGFISAEELVQIIETEQQAVESSRTLKKIIIALAVLLVLNIAATAGLTYGIVALTKDSNVDGDDILVSKSTGGPVSSGSVVYSDQLANLYNMTDPVELAGLEHLILPGDGDDSYRIYQVLGMHLVPSVSLTLNTTMPGSGSIVIDSSGVHEVVPAGTASGGRRLLQVSNGMAVLNGQVLRPRLVLLNVTSKPSRPASWPKSA